ncbi:hypothetical protein BJ944DRAFT_263095 [Cunninghamella echinulata]|nr:hypothetical protein BJ944DRAFT_263095 [Cunninghamella echinulata]
MRNSRYQPTYVEPYYPHDQYPSSSAQQQKYYTTSNEPYWAEDPTIANYYPPRQRVARKLSGGKHAHYYQNQQNHYYYPPYYESSNHNRRSYIEENNSIHDSSSYIYPEAEEVLDNNDSTEEEEITPGEVLAARNAELNKNVQPDIPNLSSSSMLDNINTSNNIIENNNSDNNNNNNTNTNNTNNTNNNNNNNINNDQHQINLKQQENQDVVQNEQEVSTNQQNVNKKNKKKLISFLQQFGKKLKSKKKNYQKRSIHTLVVQEPIGDIIDHKQRQEIIELLSSPKPPQVLSTSSPLSANNNSNNEDPSLPKLKPSKNATKVSNLKKIWVFRQVDSSPPANMNTNDIPSTTVWTGFDYENQIKISKYYNDENGVELFDTHIRQGKLPILVFPKRKICYYVTHMDGNVESLQVDCLDNSKNIQFVYRYGQQAK